LSTLKRLQRAAGGVYSSKARRIETDDVVAFAQVEEQEPSGHASGGDEAVQGRCDAIHQMSLSGRLTQKARRPDVDSIRRSSEVRLAGSGRARM
jgi:hypothetical protein